MIKPKKILFPTDFSRCSNQAFSRAYELAKRFESELHFLHAILLHHDDPYHISHHVTDLEEVRDRIVKTAEQEMDSLLRSYHTEGPSIIKALPRGISAGPVILEYAYEHEIDLIIMGTHGRRGLSHMFLGSVTEEVVRQAPCPVLTVREQEAPELVRDIAAILIPVDFSDHSKAALQNGLELARLFEAKLQLLHVIEESVHPSFYASGKTSIFELVPDIRAKSEQAMDDLLAEHNGLDVPYEKFVTEGRAAMEIVDFAEAQDTGLIVISTHGLTGLKHFLLGSVTEKVVQRASCPVLTLKAFGST